MKSFHGNPEGEIRSLKNSKGWYFTLPLVDSKGKKHTKRPHTMVAEAFIGEIPPGYHVHHKDGNKQNNRVDNLEIIHPARHSRETIRLNPHQVDGMNHYNKYERPEEICMYSLEGEYLASFPNAIAAEQITGVCHRNILQVAHKTEYKPGKIRRQAGGFIWRIKSESEVV